MSVDWHCVMCGISLDEAVSQEYNVLTMDEDKFLDENFDLESSKKHFRWERTQKNFKPTCSWDCGQNLKAWRRTGEPKSSYFNKDINCDCCGKPTTRGRVVKQRRDKGYTDFHICISCHRKKEIREGRRMWEVLNREYRVKYQKEWRKAHPKETKMYKRHYLKRVKSKKPRLGKTRKIVCAANAAITF